MKPNKRALHPVIHERSDSPKTIGFGERFGKHNSFLKEKLDLLDFLKIKREEAHKNKNPKDFEKLIQLADEIEKIIDDEEKKFMAINGKDLKQWEDWLGANP